MPRSSSRARSDRHRQHAASSGRLHLPAQPPYERKLFSLGANVVGTTDSYAQDSNQLKLPGVHAGQRLPRGAPDRAGAAVDQRQQPVQHERLHRSGRRRDPRQWLCPRPFDQRPHHLGHGAVRLLTNHAPGARRRVRGSFCARSSDDTMTTAWSTRAVAAIETPPSPPHPRSILGERAHPPRLRLVGLLAGAGRRRPHCHDRGRHAVHAAVGPDPARSRSAPRDRPATTDAPNR